MRNNFVFISKCPYNMENIINNFQEYFGIDIKEMKNRVSNYEVISKNAIKNILLSENCNVKAENFVESYLTNYDFFLEVLSDLSRNLIIYLNILEYIASVQELGNKNPEYETLLSNLNIFHYGKIIIGESINNLFFKIGRDFTCFIDILNKINSLDIHQMQIDKEVIEEYHQENDNFSKLLNVNVVGYYELSSTTLKRRCRKL